MSNPFSGSSSFSQPAVEPTDYGRIHRVPFRVVTSILFAIGICAAVGRISVRIFYQRRLYPDDYVLAFGCVTLIASFALTNVMFENIYWDMSIILGPPELQLEIAMAPGFADRILLYQQQSFATEVLCWVTIFSVKTSFLLFFRQMIDRLKSILTFWKVTVAVTILAGIYCVCSIFIACPHFGLDAIQCARDTGFTKTLVVSQIGNALNIVTDLMIVAVPVILLWTVKIRLRQKFILASFLCLSICMVVVCLVRAISEIVYSDITGANVDVQWDCFWQFVESCIAVFVVSLTAFRSLYGIKNLQQKKKRYEPWIYTYNRKLFSRKKTTDTFGDTIDDMESLPHIPGATLTGMRTMIGRDHFTTRTMPSRHDLRSVNEDPEEEGVIRVTNDWNVQRASPKGYI